MDCMKLQTLKRVLQQLSCERKLLTTSRKFFSTGCSMKAAAGTCAKSEEPAADLGCVPVNIEAQPCASIANHQVHWPIGCARVVKSCTLVITVQRAGALIAVMMPMEGDVHPIIHQKVPKSCLKVF
jgi:hypothetical protein